ncbi:RHS repeat-associated core domain-containing protein [Pseudomonas sp. LARHCG127]|uniref:RHS repeat-associated core domain-containing protein n=1 Tax=unclassified Pseudomonas TaxID=196821 RepID=UPI003984BBB7
MSSTDKTLLCRYHYDPLDRLVNCTPSTQARTQRFYLKERLTSEIQGSVQHSIFQQADQLLAQQQRQESAVETTLLAADQQRSVLHALDATLPRPLAYTPYGHRPAENGLLSLLGFNGERPDPVTGHYLLGNGYRAFNPVLMRFNSPDSLSPFGEGGLNTYAYCVGDPVNWNDPTGHTWWVAASFLSPSGVKSLATLSLRRLSLPAAALSPPSVSAVGTNNSVVIIPNAYLPPPSHFSLARRANSVKPIHQSPATNAAFAEPRSITLGGKGANTVNTPSKATVKKPLIGTEQRRWIYSKEGARFARSGLTKAAQERFDIFQNLIHHNGISAAEASRLAGQTQLKKLTGQQYQIRLSKGERVTFEIQEKARIVRILQVGGHT